MAGNARPLTRGLTTGLTAALFIGGLVLLFLGTRSILLGPDCSGLTSAECALERDILMGIARRQVLVGGALSLLGLAAFVFLRERRTS